MRWATKSYGDGLPWPTHLADDRCVAESTGAVRNRMPNGSSIGDTSATAAPTLILEIGGGMGLKDRRK
jgi:hypothetical protein